MHALGVIHGRFQVLHNDHLKYLLEGKRRCEHLVVGITNPDPTATKRDPANPERSSAGANPLSYYQRQHMLREVLCEAGLRRREFSLVPFPINLPELWEYYVPLNAVFFLTIYDEWGRRKNQLFKDRGLAVEVMWERPPGQKGISAARVRGLIAHGEPWQHLAPPATQRSLEATGGLARIREICG